MRRFENPKALGVWLYKVAKSRCLMSRRRSKFAPKVKLSLEELLPDRRELEQLAGTTGPTTESALLHREAGQHLQEAVLKLPPAHRLVLVLHDMEELSTAEIARVLRLRQGTVRVRLHRARVFVRNQLAQGGPIARRLPKRAPARPSRCKKLFARLSD